MSTDDVVKTTQQVRCLFGGWVACAACRAASQARFCFFAQSLPKRLAPSCPASPRRLALHCIAALCLAGLRDPCCTPRAYGTHPPHHHQPTANDTMSATLPADTMCTTANYRSSCLRTSSPAAALSGGWRGRRCCGTSSATPRTWARRRSQVRGLGHAALFLLVTVLLLCCLAPVVWRGPRAWAGQKI